MFIRRTSTALASALLVGGALLIAPPAAQAATTNVTVNCATSSTEAFTVAPEDVIVFNLDATCQAGLTASGATTTPLLQGLVNRMAILTGTGGTALADIASWTVTYTAGTNSGTDYLDVSQAGITRALNKRALTTSNNYSMTIPGGLAPWLQAYARAAGTSCQPGWNPSWAQWPNNNTGGFVCVRTLTYNKSSGSWDSRGNRR